MDKLLDFLGKARWGAVFLVLGVILALSAAAGAFKGFGLEFAPYNLAARLGLAALAIALLGLGVFLALRGETTSKRKIDYDLFLAAPMAAAESEEEYQEIRTLCLEVLA